jgi:hypothetical protein
MPYNPCQSHHSTDRRMSIESARLQHGDHEGDVIASYSADVIPDKKSRIRKPFHWRNALWCCVGMFGDEASAYLLTPLASFASPTTTYAEKLGIDQGDFARADPGGFYHGMRVSSGGATFILTGPEVTLTATAPKQGNLFE